MGIKFQLSERRLFLVYELEEVGVEDYKSSHRDKDFVVKRVFHFSHNKIAKTEESYNSITFEFAEINSGYIVISSDVLHVTRTYYFSEDIELKPKFFIGERNSSIFKIIDRLLPKEFNDFYIESENSEQLSKGKESKNHISIGLFKQFLFCIPKKTEIDNYINCRSSDVFNDLFPFQVENIKNKHYELLKRKDEKVARVCQNSSNFQSQYIAQFAGHIV